MIKLVHTPNEEEKEFSVDKVVVVKEDDGHISSYLYAFETFLRACGFMEATITEALPTIQ